MLATGLCFCALAYGQATGPAFEVASVKPSPPIPPDGRVYFGPARGGPGTPDPGQITWSYATIKNLLMTAYDVKAFQVSGPAWMGTERYDIVAKVPAGTTKEQVGVMWQKLLAERFGVMLHHESREFQVEELVAARGGPKLKETADDLAAALPPGPPSLDKNGDLRSAGMVSMLYSGPSPKAHTVARAQPIAQLTAMLSNQLNRPVLDRTGLTGRYDFALDYSLRASPPPPGQPGPDPAAAVPADSASDAGPDITAALQQQLGLRLVAGKAKLDVVVIEKAERVPTAN